ncbi:MAG: YkgJ family cysteine cluster protein [Deltaproteobacteria bacterium]|nr:YkgJ family cysteine cluster protein [Deltaproteobacteria bacterium]
MDVYFTWPDRRLAYECRGCGACCKGLGIGLEAAQLVQLVAKRPALAAFVRRRGDAVTAFNPRDRCWFLADDGLCRVEVEDGRAAKPAACRLFPFNRVFRVGATMVVDYNSVICPLQLSDDGVPHAEILAEIATITDPALVGTALPDDGTIERERAHEITAPDGCAGFEALIGLPWKLPRALDAALVLTSSLRFNELYGPRQYAPRPKMGRVLDAMSRAWLGFCALGEELAQRPLGMQEMTTIWSEQAPVMHALARWQDTPRLAPGRFDLPTPEVRALGQRLVANKRTTLGELLAGVDVATIKLADPILKASFA